MSAPATLLAHAARRAMARPAYLGWVLDRYMKTENFSEAQLATFLCMSVRDLPCLALCLRPRPDHFAEDVKQISAHCNTNASALASAVRLVESLDAMTSGQSEPVLTDSGLLMAARKRKQQRPSPKKRDSDSDPSTS